MEIASVGCVIAGFINAFTYQRPNLWIFFIFAFIYLKHSILTIILQYKLL
jgi:hypothetical protein